MSQHRSGGRNQPSRGERTQRRAAERRERGRTQMVIPDAVQQLTKTKEDGRG